MFRMFIFIFAVFSPYLLAEKITIGVSDSNYYPHYDFSNDKQRGYIVELLETFEQYSDYQIEFVPMPVKRLQFEFFQHGSIDAFYPYNLTWHGNKNADALHFSHPIVRTVGGTMVAPENVGRKLSSFRTLSITRGFTPTQWYEVQQQQTVNIVEVSSATDALKMVILNRVDGADVEYNVAHYLLSQLDQENALQLDPDLPYVSAEFRIVTQKKKAFVDALNKFMDSKPELIKLLKQQFNLKETLSAATHYAQPKHLNLNSN